MNNNYFVILGGNMLLRGVYDKLKSYGYDVIVVDWNEAPAIKGDIHIQADVKDTTKVISILKEKKFNIDGAFTCIDLAVPTVNEINKTFGLRTMPSFFNDVLEKKTMKRIWEEAGIFNRVSINSQDTTINEIVELNKNIDVIIKPNVAASSRGITILKRNSTLNEIKQAITLAENTSFDKSYLIEEFIDGQEFTIDMLGDDYGNVSVYGISVKYHSKNAINNRIAVKLHWNSNVYSDDTYKMIADFGRKCYKSLGLKTSFGHLEAIMKKDGTITPIEIGARTSGFIGSHLVSAVSKRDYLNDYISIIHGAKIDNVDHINSDTSSMWYGYDIPSGIICRNEVSLEQFLDKKIEVLYYNRDGLKKGHKYDKITDDNGRDNQGYEMLSGSKNILTIKNINDAEEEFLLNFKGKNI